MKSKNVLYLLFGTAVGTIIGLLFAPRAGKQTRVELKDWLDDRRAKGTAAVEEFRKNFPQQKEKLTAALAKGRSVFTRSVPKKAEPIEA